MEKKKINKANILKYRNFAVPDYLKSIENHIFNISICYINISDLKVIKEAKVELEKYGQ